MRRSLVVLTCLAGLLAAGCDSGNPVAPAAPTPNPPGGNSEALTITVTADRTQLAAGSTQPAVIKVTVRRGDGAPAPDGTEVRINTSLGSFGSDNAGQPVQLVTRTLSGGAAEVDLFAGDKTGVAVVLAQVGTSTGRLNLTIVEPSPVPVADFIFEVSDLSVLFEDASTGEPTSFAWDFGDGSTDDVQNPPPHDYAEEGTYTVTLTVSNDSGESTKRRFVTVEAGELDASFDFEVNGLSVLFTDTSAGEPTDWEWDFGDGGTSSQQNPGHSYTNPGSYAVTLVISNDLGASGTASRFVTVSRGEPPVADFATQINGLRVLFTDTSAPKATEWKWKFGDGRESEEQNPEHRYDLPGTYNVTLTAKNAAGESMKSKLVTVSRGDPPQAAFDAQVNGLRVVFTDRSTGNPTAWDWDFGDNSTDDVQNPQHTYTAPGNYTVVLKVENAAGESQASKVITVGASNPPQADFCFERDGLVVIFTDASTGSPTSWAWDFGDCEAQAATCKSTLRHPGHTYVGAGTYAVSLKATNAAGESVRTKFVNVPGDDSFPVCF